MLLQGQRYVPDAEMVTSLRKVEGLRVCGNRRRGCLISGNVWELHTCKHDHRALRKTLRFQEDAQLASKWDPQKDAPAKAQSIAKAFVGSVDHTGDTHSSMEPAGTGSTSSAAKMHKQLPQKYKIVEI